MRSLLLILLAALPAQALSQEMYKCPASDGSRVVYQGVPCRGGTVLVDRERARQGTTQAPSSAQTSLAAEPAPPPVSAAEETAAIEAGKELCRTLGVRSVAWKDPESVRVGLAYGGQEQSVALNRGGRSWGRQFFLDVNARNGYGGYTGKKPLICYTSRDGKELLSVDSSLL